MRERATLRRAALLRSGVDDDRHEVPVGSELLIAFALGAAGWWGIVRTVMWITS